MDGDLRLCEILGSLSLATDLGNGFAPEHALRTALLAVELLQGLGAEPVATRAALYTALLKQIGCTALDYEMGHRYGDPAAARRVFSQVDSGQPAQTVPHVLRNLGRGEAITARGGILAHFLAAGKKEGEHAWQLDCAVATRFSKRLGTPEGVTEALGQLFDRWDGDGLNRLAGEDICPAARAVAVAWAVVVHHEMAGRKHALDFLQAASGGWFDPAIVQAFFEDADRLFGMIEAESVWHEVLEAEPVSHATMPFRRLDAITESFADFVDLRSPYMLGHSSSVGSVARDAARTMGLPEGEAATLRHVGRLHDLGRLSVPTTIWDKPGPLSPASWERVRLHAYQTERILAVSPTLAPYGRLAGMHHERMDGSGYHRGSTGSLLPLAARVLAAADAFVAMTEPRAHRPALAPDQAAKELRAGVTEGLFDAGAANAVCECAGQTGIRARAPNPAGLTEREVQILALLARGNSKKQIAVELFISPGTVHTHVTHIYEKIGISGRAAAALFAMENGLVGATERDSIDLGGDWLR